MAANEHTSIIEGTIEPRRTRNQPARIPLAATGEFTGHCFIAAFLAHVMHVDLAKKKIPKEEITKLRSLEGVPLRGYIGGSAQQIIADYKRVGYIIVNPDKCTATQYTSNHVADPADLQWALLVHCGNSHIEPIPTKGGQQCGLLSYAAAEQQLKDLNIDLKPKLAGETLEASDDDDEPTAGTKPVPPPSVAEAQQALQRAEQRAQQERTEREDVERRVRASQEGEESLHTRLAVTQETIARLQAAKTQLQSANSEYAAANTQLRAASEAALTAHAQQLQHAEQQAFAAQQRAQAANEAAAATHAQLQHAEQQRQHAETRAEASEAKVANVVAALGLSAAAPLRPAPAPCDL